MPRSRPKVYAHARHKKVLKFTKGQQLTKSKLFRRANEAMLKSLFYAYRDRRNKKRNFRALWIQRINAAVRQHGLTYGRFIDGLVKAEIAVDRKVLSDIAITEPAAFAALVAQSKKALGYLGEIEATTAARVA